MNNEIIDFLESLMSLGVLGVASLIIVGICIWILRQ